MFHEVQGLYIYIHYGPFGFHLIDTFERRLPHYEVYIIWFNSERRSRYNNINFLTCTALGVFLLLLMPYLNFPSPIGLAPGLASGLTGTQNLAPSLLPVIKIDHRFFVVFKISNMIPICNSFSHSSRSRHVWRPNDLDYHSCLKPPGRDSETGVTG